MTTLPKTLGTCADRAYKLQQERLQLQKRVDEMKSQETTLLKHAETLMQKDHLEVCKGKLGQIRRSAESVPQVKDWGKFYAYLKKSGEFEFMQRRLVSAAFRERWEQGKKIPGVERVDLVRPRLSKA